MSAKSFHKLRTTRQTLTNDVRSVQLKALTMEVDDQRDQRFRAEVAEDLAEGCALDCGFTPPIVEPSGNGKYRVLAGHYDVYVCDKVLKHQAIVCLVLPNPNAEIVKNIELAIYADRGRRDQQQRRRAIRRWRELFEQLHLGGTENVRRQRGNEFAKLVEQLLHVSPGYARRLATTAEYITPEVRENLEKAGLTQTEIDGFATLREPKAIARASALVADGVSPGVAIRIAKPVKPKVTKPDKPKVDSANCRADRERAAGDETQQSNGFPSLQERLWTGRDPSVSQL
jgi:hypothetical protein